MKACAVTQRETERGQFNVGKCPCLPDTVVFQGLVPMREVLAIVILLSRIWYNEKTLN